MPRAERPIVYKDPDWLALTRTDPNWYASARNSPDWITLSPDTLSFLVRQLRCKKEDKDRITAVVKRLVEFDLSLYKSQILNRPTSASQISALEPLQKAARALVKELCKLSQDNYTRPTLYPYPRVDQEGRPFKLFEKSSKNPFSPSYKDKLTSDLEAVQRINEKGFRHH